LNIDSPAIATDKSNPRSDEVKRKFTNFFIFAARTLKTPKLQKKQIIMFPNAFQLSMPADFSDHPYSICKTSLSSLMDYSTHSSISRNLLISAPCPESHIATN
jgi:negative regulator of genetic competence, sporulation and motility